MNSIQNNPMDDDIKKRETRGRTAAALTENPARALVAVLEVLKLTCSCDHGEGKREAPRSARVLLDWKKPHDDDDDDDGHRKIDLRYETASLPLR